jgi:hypothetical protein
VTEVSEPGVKPNEYYMFTQELNANESKLGVPAAVFTLTNIIVHKGDNVTIHFYNTGEDVDDRHSCTMQSPYKMTNLPVERIEHLVSRLIQYEVLPFTVYTIYPV